MVESGPTVLTLRGPSMDGRQVTIDFKPVPDTFFVLSDDKTQMHWFRVERDDNGTPTGRAICYLVELNIKLPKLPENFSVVEKALRKAGWIKEPQE